MAREVVTYDDATRKTGHAAVDRGQGGSQLNHRIISPCAKSTRLWIIATKNNSLKIVITTGNYIKCNFNCSCFRSRRLHFKWFIIGGLIKPRIRCGDEHFRVSPKRRTAFASILNSRSAVRRVVELDISANRRITRFVNLKVLWHCLTKF